VMHKNLLNFPVFKPYSPTHKPTGVIFGVNESTLVHPSVQHVAHVGKKLHTTSTPQQPTELNTTECTMRSAGGNDNYN